MPDYPFPNWLKPIIWIFNLRTKAAHSMGCKPSKTNTHSLPIDLRASIIQWTLLFRDSPSNTIIQKILSGLPGHALYLIQYPRAHERWCLIFFSSLLMPTSFISAPDQTISLDYSNLVFLNILFQTCSTWTSATAKTISCNTKMCFSVKIQYPRRIRINNRRPYIPVVGAEKGAGQKTITRWF